MASSQFPHNNFQSPPGTNQFTAQNGTPSNNNYFGHNFGHVPYQQMPGWGPYNTNTMMSPSGPSIQSVAPHALSITFPSVAGPQQVFQSVSDNYSQYENGMELFKALQGRDNTVEFLVNIAKSRDQPFWTVQKVEDMLNRISKSNEYQSQLIRHRLNVVQSQVKALQDEVEGLEGLLRQVDNNKAPHAIHSMNLNICLRSIVNKIEGQVPPEYMTKRFFKACQTYHDMEVHYASVIVIRKNLLLSHQVIFQFDKASAQGLLEFLQEEKYDTGKECAHWLQHYKSDGLIANSFTFTSSSYWNVQSLQGVCLIVLGLVPPGAEHFELQRGLQDNPWTWAGEMQEMNYSPSPAPTPAASTGSATFGAAATGFDSSDGSAFFGATGDAPAPVSTPSATTGGGFVFGASPDPGAPPAPFAFGSAPAPAFQHGESAPSSGA